MAGSPLKRLKRAAVEAELTKVAADSELSVLEWVIEYTGRGGTLTALAEGIGKAQKCDVGREMVRRYIESLAPDAAAQIERARVQGGRALLEETLPIADSATPDEHQVAKLRIEARRYVAGVFDPSTRENKGISIAISAGSLHLDALRHANRPATAVLSEVQPSTALPSQVVETQEVEVEKGV